ncbi:MAG: PCYCGC motif-containing (lipo)protein [Candidatus Sulfotelmatobacter sp.]
MPATRLLQRKFVHRALTLALLLFVTLTMTSLWAAPQEQEGTGIPAYNAGPPPKGTKLPAVLTKDQLWGADAQYPYQTHAYDLAAKIPAVLHQQPCYCFCDRMGHNSLHSCFESTHGARCATCLKELYYSYKQHQAGKTATQIRAGIIKGEWKQIDLETAATIN